VDVIINLSFFHKPRDQHPLVSFASLLLRCHLLQSQTRLFSSCIQALHQLTVSSIRLSLLFVPSTIPNISVFLTDVNLQKGIVEVECS